MDTPITWRNIEVPDFRAATIGMSTVGNSLEAARRLLTQSIAETERIDAENWDNTKANNTNAVLNRLLEYQDPESFEKARQAREFQTLMDQYGGQIDANLVRKSVDERADVLRNRAINALDYQNRLRTEEEAKVAREQKPILDRILGLVEQGELTPATEAARVYADSGMLREDFLRQILESARTRQEGIEDRNLNKPNGMSAIGYRNAQADAARAKEDTTKRPSPVNMQLANKAEEWYKEWEKDSILGRGTLDTNNGRDAMGEVFKTFNLTPNAQQDVWENMEKYFPGGYYTRRVKGEEVRIPIPVDLVHRALTNTDEIGNGSIWSRRGDKVAAYIQEALEDPRIVKEIADSVRVRDWRKALKGEVGTDPGVAAAMPTFVYEALSRYGQTNSPENKK